MSLSSMLYLILKAYIIDRHSAKQNWATLYVEPMVTVLMLKVDIPNPNYFLFAPISSKKWNTQV